MGRAASRVLISLATAPSQKTAGMGEAIGKAVKGDPLSAAFVLGKFALRDYGNPCAELRQLEELVARNPRARCRENVSGTASAGRDEHMTGL